MGVKEGVVEMPGGAIAYKAAEIGYISVSIKGGLQKELGLEPCWQTIGSHV